MAAKDVIKYPLKTVWITTTFPGLHHWPDAPEGSFLRFPHRHLFHVCVEVLVNESNREVEFFNLKSKVDRYVCSRFACLGESELSCESMADIIWMQFEAMGYRMYEVTVSEDGENGATLRAQ